VKDKTVTAEVQTDNNYSQFTVNIKYNPC